MKFSINNRRFIFAILTIFIFVFGTQMVGAASAPKLTLLTSGHVTNAGSYGSSSVYYWKTYKKGNNYVKVKGTVVWRYGDGTGGKINSLMTLQKVSKTKLKIVQKINKEKSTTYYVKTRLSAVSFYKNKQKQSLKYKTAFITWYVPGGF